MAILLIPNLIESQEDVSRNPEPSSVRFEQLELVAENPIDFESFRVNDLELRIKDGRTTLIC
jgi:hypothetical protein